MAFSDKLTLNATLQYEDLNGIMDALQVPNLIKTFGTRKKIRHTQIVTASEAALELGGITSLGYFLAVNMDPTNSINVRASSGGIHVAILDPAPETGKCGGFCFYKFGSGITVPFVVTTAGNCTLEYLLISA